VILQAQKRSRLWSRSFFGLPGGGAGRSHLGEGSTVMGMMAVVSVLVLTVTLTFGREDTEE
jgi:hypothetical protein